MLRQVPGRGLPVQGSPAAAQPANAVTALACLHLKGIVARALLRQICGFRGSLGLTRFDTIKTGILLITRALPLC